VLLSEACHGVARFTKAPMYSPSRPAGVRSDGGAVNYHAKESGPGPDIAVVPEAGRCLLFQQPPGQCYFHDGEELGSGCKYLFRSDVMYRRVSQT